MLSNQLPDLPPSPPRRRPPPPPRRAPGALALSLEQRNALTDEALGLLSEQIQARVVHYRADLETNAELDAITAQVVAQVRAMQRAAHSVAPGERSDRDQIEHDQVRGLTHLLERLLVGERSSDFVTHQIKPIGRKIARLFFESELHERTKGNKERVIRHSEQGVYYLLHRYQNRMQAELEGFEYSEPEIRQATFDLLSKMERDLQMAFLSRRSPELNRVMTVYTAVVTEFLEQVLPEHLGSFATEVIAQSGSARLPDAVAYKVGAQGFQGFRAAWEKGFVHRLIAYCGEELVGRLEASDEEYLDETVRFFTDPRVFSETAEVLNDAFYDYLCQEGFLDLPLDWRLQLETAAP